METIHLSLSRRPRVLVFHILLLDARPYFTPCLLQQKTAEETSSGWELQTAYTAPYIGYFTDIPTIKKLGKQIYVCGFEVPSIFGKAKSLSTDKYKSYVKKAQELFFMYDKYVCVNKSIDRKIKLL